MVNGDQLGAIGKGGFHLDVVDHLGNALHDLVAGDERGAVAHEFGHGLAVAGTFENLGGDQGDDLGVVQLQAAVTTTSGKVASHDHQQLLLFARGQVHGSVRGEQCK